jgi:hypothetical protein
MPNPKDHLDDDYEFVGGYVRRKRGTDSAPEPKRISWFWRIRWYWRLLIIMSAIGLVIGLATTKHFMILGGIVLAIVFWYWFFHPPKSGHSSDKTAKKIWRKLI